MNDAKPTHRILCQALFNEEIQSASQHRVKSNDSSGKGTTNAYLLGSPGCLKVGGALGLSLATFVLAVLPTAAALATPTLSLDQIINQARRIADYRPPQLTCDVVTSQEELNGQDHVTEEERSLITITYRGDAVDAKLVRRWQNGKELPADALAKARIDFAERQRSNRGQDTIKSPFSSSVRADYRFVVQGEEIVAGRNTYRIQVIPQRETDALFRGTAWIDVENFVEVRGEYVPAKLPAQVDSMTLNYKFALGPKGAAIPVFMQIRAKGHFLFLKKNIRMTRRLSGCT